MNLAYTINTLFYFYFIIIILRILLTWIPNIDWYSQPFRTISAITDWYLNLFKKIIPPFGGLDFSPIIAIVVLQVIQRIILTLIVSLGLA